MSGEARAFPTGVAELEKWFVDRLCEDAPPVADMRAALDAVRAAGRPELADAWAEMLQEWLADARRRDEALALLDQRAGWHEGDPAFRDACRAAASDLLKKERTPDAFCAESGFQGDVPARECIRRMRTLLSLRRGAPCYHATWGFGTVQDVDAFYRQVVVDFARRPQHQFSMAYAAETLSAVDASHICAIRHLKPDAFAAMRREQPAELVRMAIRQFGPMNAVRLQNFMAAEGLVAESEWPEFWEAARRQLRDDPLFHLPAKRAEPMRLLDRAAGHDARWFGALAAERDPGRILDLAGELAAAGPGAAADAEAKRVLAERLGYVVRSTNEQSVATLTRALLAADQLGVTVDGFDAAAASAALRADPAKLVRVLNELPGRLLGRFLDWVAREDAEQARRLLLETLPQVGFTAVAEIYDFMDRAGRADAFVEEMRQAFNRQSLSVEMLAWLVRRMDLVGSDRLFPPLRLARQILKESCKPWTGARLKVSRELRAFLRDKDWMHELFARMAGIEKRQFLLELKADTALPESERQGILARMITVDPSLRDAFESSARAEPEADAAVSLTSWRSHRRRQTQLEKLVNEDIPKNSQAIAHARSYGDLSENFEYSAAKDQQRVLLQRRQELEADLKRVRGTDFEGVPADRAGLGTRVALKAADGRTAEFTILGEWDTDESLRIISNKTAVAAALAGRRKGESVELPGEHGPESWTVEDVTPFGDDVRAWLRG